MINYYLITKPGIIMGNLLTVAAGFLLASKGVMHWGLFLATMLGLAFIIASACVFNNYIDLPLDKKMERTKNRALVIGLISVRHALTFAVILGIIGNLILFYFTNVLTVVIAAVGFFVYVFLYSLWKSRTIYGTAIGSVAGAIPPLVGYCAVSNRLDLGALILFIMLVLWQMPHFFAIAMYHYKDYSTAGIPVLPIKKGAFRAKIHMVIYILGFICAAALLTYFNFTGYTYLVITSVIGFSWLAFCLKGFSTQNDVIWGRDMFRLSLIMIMAICILIPLDTVSN